MPTPLTPIETATIIAELDPAFIPLIELVGPPPRRVSGRVSERFPTLARAITGQLLATKAAATIHQRVIDLCAGDVTAASITAAGHESLRGVGLSNAKAAAMLDLAERTLDGRLRLKDHGRMNDLEVLKNVVAVKGVGPWTAQMYLMSMLARHDVWPPGDLGVRNGWSLLHELPEYISEKDLKREGDLFVGVRSSVAYYCWEAVHVQRGQ